MGRPHSARLLHGLKEVRNELVETVAAIPVDQFNWAPADGMKSYAALLQEIGTMEKLSTNWLNGGEMLPWEMAAYVSGDSPEAALSDLATIRAETIAYLEAATEEKLETPIPVPQEWQQYMGTELEPEEALRWVTMHEYYHLGQIITYRWSTGHSPYTG